MAQRYCIECDWCELRVGVEGASCYFCRKSTETLTSEILWRPACKDFVPMIAWTPRSSRSE